MKKIIRNTFFNPILHLLPLIVFLIADQFYGLDFAWKMAFPVVMILIIYLYFGYKNAFVWNLLFTLLFLAVGLFSAFTTTLFTQPIFKELSDNITVTFFLLLFILFRNRIERVISAQMPALIPMKNNFLELYKVIRVLLVILIAYIVSALIINLTPELKNGAVGSFLSYAFVIILIILSAYEIVRILLIRHQLQSEEWWPIVNQKGKIIGSIEHLTSLADQKNYLHPVARILVIDKNRILLRLQPSDHIDSPGLWDTTVTSHILMNESIENCVQRAASESLKLNPFKHMYLSNYTSEKKQENQYALLFLSCKVSDNLHLSETVEPTKWWTQKQIEENLEAGIFSSGFLIEYDLIKRSGLLDTANCQCSCGLKKAIYNYAGVLKADEDRAGE